jgi:hypothetical protein
MDAIKELKRGSLLKLEQGRGTVVRVVTGSVWLTQHHDTTDYVMGAGESMLLSGAGTTLIHACKDSSLQFVAPEITRSLRKVELRLIDPITVSA